MKSIRKGLAVFAATLLLCLFVLSKLTGAPSFTYVYSASMEPLIHVNDGFLVLPAPTPKVGDIIVYRPNVLDAELITHRIIESSSRGFITKGDNLSNTDQESGEPEVLPHQVMGKVWEWKGKPVTFSKLGDGIDFFNSHSIFFRMGGVLFILGGSWIALKDRKNGSTSLNRNRKRRRIRKVGRTTVIVLSFLLFIQQIAVIKTETVQYLVSSSPSDPSSQFYPKQSGKITYKIENHSFFSVWYLPEGEGTLQLENVPHIIPPFGEDKMFLKTTPHSQTGWYKEYFKIYTYPALLPYRLIKLLQSIHPIFSALATSLTCGAILGILLTLAYRVLEINPDTPLKALHNKKNRQWERKLKLFFKVAERKK